MSAVVDFAEDIFDFVGDAIDWVGDAIGDVADFVADKILSPIVDFAGGVLDGFMENPLTSIAKIAAAVYGQPWAIALVNGASTAIEGGDLGDVLMSTAGSYIASSLGGQASSLMKGVTDAAPEALGFVSDALSNEFVSDIVGKGAVSATTAIIYGEDPVEAFLRGGVTAGVSAGLGQIQDYLDITSATGSGSGLEGVSFQDSGTLTDTVMNVVGAGMQSFLAEGEVTPEAIANAVTRGFITTDVVADLAGSLGKGYFEDPTALAYTTAAVQRVVGTALSGGSGQQAYAALESTLDAYGSVKFKEVLDDFNIQEVIGETVDVLSGTYDDIEKTANTINTVGLRRQADAQQYERMRLELKTELDAIEEDKIALANIGISRPGYNAPDEYDLELEEKNARDALDERIRAYTELRNQYAPRMAELGERVVRDSELLETAKSELEGHYANLNTSVDQLDDKLKPLNDGFTKAMTLTMDPGFNESEYRELNNLGNEVDAFDHFLTEGHRENVYTSKRQFEAAQDAYDRNVSAMTNRVLNVADIDPGRLDNAALREVRSRIVDTYPNPADLRTALNDDALRVSGFIPLQSQYAFEASSGTDDDPANSFIFQAQLKSMHDTLQDQGALPSNSVYPQGGISLSAFMDELRENNLLAPDYTPPGMSEVQTFADELRDKGLLPETYEFETPSDMGDDPTNSFVYQTYLNSIQDELQDGGFLSSKYAPDAPKNDVQTLAQEVEDSLGNREANPYRNATLNPELRARLAGMGIDTKGAPDGAELSSKAKVALDAQDNKERTPASLASGTTWGDVTAGKAVIQIDEEGNRTWNNTDLASFTETVWDPEHGLVNIITEFDDQGRPFTRGYSPDNIEIPKYRDHKISQESAAALTDSLHALSQINADREQIENTIGDTALIKEAGKDLGSTDAAIDFVSDALALTYKINKDRLINSTANAIRAGGDILQSFNGLVTYAGIVPSDTPLGEFAAATIEYGEDLNTPEYKARAEKFYKDLNSSDFKKRRTAELINNDKLTPEEAADRAEMEYTELPWYERAIDTVYTMGGAIAYDPEMFLSDLVGVEILQEVVPIVAGGAVGAGIKGSGLLIGVTISDKLVRTGAISGAIGTEMALSAGDAAQSAVNEAQKVTKYAINPETGERFTEAEGEEFALKHGVKVGTVAALATGASYLIGGAAWEKAFFGKNGNGQFGDLFDASQINLKKIGDAASRETVTETFDEAVTAYFNYAGLYPLDRTIDVPRSVTAMGFLGGTVGGTTGGTIGLMGQIVEGIRNTDDPYASVVTTLNPYLKETIANTPNTPEGIQSTATTLTNLGITGAAQDNILNDIDDPGYISPPEAEFAFRSANPDYQISRDEINKFTGAGDEAQTSQEIRDYVDSRYVDTQEVVDAAALEGVTITEEQAAEYVGQRDEASTLAAATQKYDSLATSADEAQSVFTATGYVPTDAEINQFVRQGSEAETASDIEAYVGPRQVTTDEAQSLFDELGYTPTEQEVTNLVGQGGADFETTTAEEVANYVGPRQVTESEVRAIYEDLGLGEATQADVDRFVGQFDPGTADYGVEDFQSTVESDIREFLPIASANMVREYVAGLDPQGTGAAQDLSAEIESAQGAVDQLSTDFDLAIGDTQQQITDLGTDLTTDIQSVSELVGKPAQDVTRADIDFVADVIAQNQVLNEQQVAAYDVTGDGTVDINDQALLEQALGGGQVDIASTSQFAPTGIYGTVQNVQTDLTQQMDQNQQQTLDTIQQIEQNRDIALQRNQEQTREMLQQMEQNFRTNLEDQATREGARNFLQMALQAPDAAGQQVSVKTPDPLELGYLYDFSSIFANPTQQALFPTPYAKGGRVDDTTNRLLRIIGDS